VEQRNVRCPECLRIADRILGADVLLVREKCHSEHDVTGAYETRRACVRDGVMALQARNRDQHVGAAIISPEQELRERSRDEGWLATLLRRWPCLPPEVRGQLQTSMSLPSRDRKNQRRLEKKLKTGACKSETFRHDTAGRKVHS